MNALMIFLIFSLTPTALAGVKSQSLQEAEHWYGCGVDLMDIQSENRFKVCGGKSVLVPAYDEKEGPDACRAKKAELLDTILRFEKKYNFCELAEDCIAGEVGHVHYHMNRTKITEASKAIDAKYAEVKDACKPASEKSDWQMNAVHKKDSRNVMSYTCEQKMCVPHYKGNLLDWSPLRKRDWDKERQKVLDTEKKTRKK